MLFGTIETDSINNNGYSIFQFNFTQSHTNTNRYQALHDSTNQNVCAAMFFHNGSVVMHINSPITDINEEYGSNHVGEWINKLVNCYGNDLNVINIPWSMLQSWQSNNISTFNFLIEYDDKYFGYILVYWHMDSTVYMRKNCRYIECNLAGAGSFMPPLDARKYNVGIKDHVGGEYIPIIESEMIGKTRFDLTYDDRINHSVAIVVNEIKMKWCGDHKHLYYLFGMAGGTSNNPCPTCVANNTNLHAHPTPQNRQWISRSECSIQEAWLQSVARNGGTVDGINSNPILVAGPDSLAIPVLHMIQGLYICLCCWLCG